MSKSKYLSEKEPLRKHKNLTSEELREVTEFLEKRKLESNKPLTQRIVVNIKCKSPNQKELINSIKAHDANCEGILRSIDENASTVFTYNKGWLIFNVRRPNLQISEIWGARAARRRASPSREGCAAVVRSRHQNVKNCLKMFYVSYASL